MKIQQLNWMQFIPFFSLSILFVLAGCNSPQNPFSRNNSALVQAPADQDHLIYTLSDTYIRAFHSKTGHLAWTQQKNPSSGSYQEAFVTKNTVYVVGNNDLYSYDAASGKPRWSSPATSAGISNIVVDATSVYIVILGGVAESFNAENGHLQWNRVLNAPSDAPSSTQANSVVIIQNGVLYINNTDSFVAALQASNGKQLWSKIIPDARKIDDLILHNAVLYGITDSGIAALNIQDGSILWQDQQVEVDSMVMLSSTMDISTSNGSFQVQLSDGGMRHLNLPNGSIEISSYSSVGPCGHSIELPGYSVDFKHQYLNGTVYIIDGTTSGNIMAVQVSNGSTIWRSPDSAGTIISLCVLGTDVYAVQNDGKTMLFDGKSGAPIWKNPMPLNGQPEAIDDNNIYNVSDGLITAINIHTGTITWTAITNGNETSSDSLSFAPLVFMSSN